MIKNSPQFNLFIRGALSRVYLSSDALVPEMLQTSGALRKRNWRFQKARRIDYHGRRPLEGSGCFIHEVRQT